jgi:Protein of unknown function (DUF3461)
MIMKEDVLKSLGVKSLDTIDYYIVRNEKENDILKIYHKREKGSLFSKSEKFKFRRSIRQVPAANPKDISEINEISPMLSKLMDALDQITQKKRQEITAKEKILEDLRHLEKVVANKVSEIEAQLEKL